MTVADSASGQRIIFLGGAPRSGTTLVQNMLDSHPDILGGPEFLHLQDIVALRDKLQASVARGWIDLICSSADVDDQIRALINNFLVTFADRHGAQLLSEKTPENVLVFPRLLELFPQSRFIHVVRDPRAIVASMLSVGERARSQGETPAPFTANIQAAVAYLRRCLEAGFRASHASPNRVLTVVYEHLVQDPEKEGRRLCGFLGVNWVSDMAKPGEHEHLGAAAITVNSKEIWYDAKTYYSNPNTASVEKWRETLAPYQQIMINRAFENCRDLNELGYRFKTEGLRGAPKLIAILRCNASEVRTRVATKLRRTLRPLL